MKKTVNKVFIKVLQRYKDRENKVREYLNASGVANDKARLKELCKYVIDTEKTPPVRLVFTALNKSFFYSRTFNILGRKVLLRYIFLGKHAFLPVVLLHELTHLIEYEKRGTHMHDIRFFRTNKRLLSYIYLFYNIKD